MNEVASIHFLPTFFLTLPALHEVMCQNVHKMFHIAENIDVNYHIEVRDKGFNMSSSRLCPDRKKTLL